MVTEDAEVKIWSGGSEANAPVLDSGMIPVKYNTETENWVICSTSDENWYSYTEEDKQWANVMLSDGKYTTSTAEIGTEVAEADLGSMFVWIPRYVYKITSGYHSTSGSIDVVWLSGTSYDYIDEDGKIKTALNGNEEGAITSSGYTDYVTHPAFTDGSNNETEYGTENYQNGEWRTEITGMWIAKFQAGIYTTENDTDQTVKISSSQSSSTAGATVYYPVFKGRKYAYNYVSASQCYDISLALDDSENPYGLNSSANSHLLKSSEWGVAAYLSISKYGYSGGTATTATEKAKNNLSIIVAGTNSGIAHPNNSSNCLTAITGYSAPGGKTAQNYMSSETLTNFDVTTLIDTITGNNGNSYAWNYVDSGSTSGSGTLSSTTGNIYGIYDMGGCLADYTASYVYAEGVSYLTTYGGSFTTGTSTYLSTAYPYQTDTGVIYETDYKDFTSAYPGFRNIFGDAIYETSSNTGSGLSWFGQYLDSDSDLNVVFFPCGGNWNKTGNVGLCGFNDNNGNANNNYGFRSVLVVE